ncbi:ATP-grasp fold amidoligase family protein [Pseudoalteromonas sp.]|uniref:ATP-grasp fold amidoligase family protein n=1 Tax=unclassified Pseudoalteromonas TaxID=194690 RepID=UPI003F9922FF
MKKLLKEIIFIRKVHFWLRFVYKNRYIPNFKNPKTYNEKVNYRKRNANHPLFSLCADKIAAKEYVASKIGEQYIIPNLYTGSCITLEQIQALLTEHGDCLLKANHNSGPVYLLTTDMTEYELKAACDDVNHQLTIDFGKYQNEPWYSDIKPQVLVEKRIYPEEGEKDLKDYKFHVFKQDDGSFKVLLHVDFDRTSNHSRSFFDERLNWLPFSSFVPSVYSTIKPPENYNKMLESAKLLADQFTYVRVDFYNISGDIYFGELTFAPGTGSSAFTSVAYDLWVGNLWQGDPAK